MTNAEIRGRVLPMVVAVLLLACAAPTGRPVARLSPFSGCRMEFPAVLAGMAVVSVALALLIWRRPTRVVTGFVVVFAMGAGVLDVAEVVRQLTAGRTGLAALAGLIAVLRAAIVIVLWRAAPRRHTATAA